MQPRLPASASSRSSELRADALAPASGRHGDRQHVALATSRQQPGIADDPAVDLGDQVVPAGRLLAELADQHLPRPGLLAEQVQLQREHAVQVRRGHRAELHLGHGVTRLGLPGSRASGRRR